MTDPHFTQAQAYADQLAPTSAPAFTAQPAPEERKVGLTKAEFAERNAAHGGRLKILKVRVEGETVRVIVRPLTRAEYHRTQEEARRSARDGTNRDHVVANAVRTSLIAPSVEEFNLMLEKYPAIAEGFANRLFEMAGAEAEVEEETFL